MRSKTEIIDNQIVNSVEQLACFLKQGDIFRKPRGSTKYMFEELLTDSRVVVCVNMNTQVSEQIYSNSPVYRLVGI
jgi:hypothetical protein